MAEQRFGPAVCAALIASIESGATIKAACVAAGISKGIFYRWMSAGRLGDSLKAEFRDRIFAAMSVRAQRELEAVLAVLRPQRNENEESEDIRRFA